MVGGRGKIKEDYWCWLSPVAVSALPPPSPVHGRFSLPYLGS